jgi:serine phosphatase RsbU (regulator of sigma subunit)
LAAVRRTGLLDTGPDEAFDRLTRLAATLLGTPFAFVTLVDDTRSFWKSCVGVDAAVGAERQCPIGESFCQYVIGTDRELIVTDAARDTRTRGNLSIDRMGVRAWAGFPIRAAGGHVLGTFCAVDIVVRDWTPHDLEVLDTLSHAAAGEIALRIAVADAEHATRQAQSSARHAQSAIMEALEAADEAAMLSRTLQESLLPPHLPEIPGLDLAARHLRGGRGADVLGDFYDVFQSPHGNWGLVVGDVSGKGAQAAKTTALARYTLRAAAVRTSTPSANLAALNTALLDWFTDDSQFLTAVYATARPHPTGFTVRVACGGHEPALIRRRDGRVESLGVPGIILGCVADPQLRDQRTLLRTGDSMIMYTDGVTEARRPEDRDMFGTERLRGLLAETPATSAAHLAAAVETAVLDFTGRHLNDDTAILALHVSTDPNAT